MSFDYSYSRPEKNIERTYETILPFFGYTKKTQSHIGEHTTGGEIEVTHQYGDVYTVKKTPERHYTTTTNYIVFERTRALNSPEALKLEDQFEKELNNTTMPVTEKIYNHRKISIKKILLFFNLFYRLKKPVTIWNTHYIDPTLEDFHKKHGGETVILRFLRIMGRILLGIAAFLGLCILSNAFEGTSDDFADYPLLASFVENPLLQKQLTIIFAAVGLVLCISIAIYFAVVRKTPFSKKKRSYKRNLKKLYYRDMVRLYGKAMGEILQKYSALK